MEPKVDFEFHDSLPRVQDCAPIFDDTEGFIATCFSELTWALLRGLSVAVHEDVILVVNVD